MKFVNLLSTNLIPLLLLASCGGEPPLPPGGTSSSPIAPLQALLAGNTSNTGNSADADSGTGSNAPTATASANLPLGLGCGWFIHSDADKANIAFPDTQAKYWAAILPVSTQNRIRITGRFPDARYFSFNTYDPAQRPVDAVADAELDALQGDNPFTTAGAKSGGQYTLFLQAGESPSQNPKMVRAPNTLYSGNIQLGPIKAPNSGLVLLMYRVYVSNTGKFFDGGVGLPTLTVESADGRQQLGTLPTCADSPLPSLAGALPDLGLNQILLNADYPDQLALPFPTATYPPRTNKFFGLAEVGTQILDAQLGIAPPSGALELGGGGFLSNLHNAYTSSTFSRRYGSLALVRAKAPTWRGATGVPFGRENMRYWSLCGNEFATQRYTDCAADFQVPLDKEGYFTAVIADSAQRPSNATAANGFTFIPWGPYPDQVLIYRHMLPNLGFAQAIQNVNKGDQLSDKMGDFAPQSTYCRFDVFARAASAAEAFKLCSQDQTQNPPSQVPGL